MQGLFLHYFYLIWPNAKHSESWQLEKLQKWKIFPDVVAHTCHLSWGRRTLSFRPDWDTQETLSSECFFMVKEGLKFSCFLMFLMHVSKCISYLVHVSLLETFSLYLPCLGLTVWGSNGPVCKLVTISRTEMFHFRHKAVSTQECWVHFLDRNFPTFFLGLIAVFMWTLSANWLRLNALLQTHHSLNREWDVRMSHAVYSWTGSSMHYFWAF